MRARPLALLALAPLLISACGASEEDKDDVRRTVNALYDAIAEKDEKRACAQLSRQGKRDLTKNSSPGGGRPQSCETVFGLRFTFAGDASKSAREAKVTDVEIKGDEAKATVEFRGQEGEVGLVKEAGRWKLTGVDLE